jgi:hypothetical protein
VSANLLRNGAAPCAATNLSTPTELAFAVVEFAVAKLAVMAISRWSNKNAGDSVPDFF